MTDFFTKPIRMSVLEKIVIDPPKDECESKSAAMCAMQEVIDILGPEKFSHASESFFGEFERFLQSAKGQRMTRTQMALEAHKLKGGAAVLAFEGLEQTLLKAIVVFQEASEQKLGQCLEHLETSKLESQNLARSVLKTLKKNLQLENVE
jgi:hypothetical protein